MADFAHKHDLQMHVHLSETKSEQVACIQRHGMTPAAVFEKYGLWDTPAIAAHCVWTSPEDWEILRRHGVNVKSPAAGFETMSVEDLMRTKETIEDLIAEKEMQDQSVTVEAAPTEA